MSYKKFKFISPGIFITEIDNSQLPREAAAIGPALIGRTAQGPALKPVRIESFADYIDMFGNPIPGGKGGDVFRDGNFTAPTYAAYAAQAWLRNNSPATIVRLLGQTNQDATNSDAAYAGWKTDQTDASTTRSSNGGAFGLFVCEGGDSTISSSSDPWPTTGVAADAAATATVMPGNPLPGSSTLAGKTIKLTNSDGTSVTWTCAAGGGNSATAIEANNASTADFATNIKAAFDAAVTAGTLKMTVSAITANSTGELTVITLTQTATGLAGNKAITGTTIDNDYILCNQTTKGGAQGTEAFTGGTGPAVLSGTLAAVWYLDTGAIALSGQTVDTTATTYTASMGGFIRAVDTGPTFKVLIQNSAAGTVIDSSFNFNSNSSRFIRKVFNTNPTLTNTTVSDGTTNYWLGESFEGNLSTFKDGENGVSGSVPSNTFGVILKLGTPLDGITGGNFKMSTSKSPSGQFAKTGWFISQDLTTASGSYTPVDMQKLFRFVSRELGEETQRKIKISIQDIKVSNDPNDDYGSFSVVVRSAKDLDSAPTVLEQYNNCNLNPASENYIAKKIGNRYEQWDDTDRRYRYYGDYFNISNYVYVEMNENVTRATTNALYLPFGVYGSPRYLGWQVSGSDAARYDNINTKPAADTGLFVVSGSAAKNPITVAAGGITLTGSTNEGNVVAMKAQFPQLRLRVSSSEGFIADPTDAYFGVDTTYNSTRFDPSVYDVLRTKADDINGIDADSNYTENSWVFSLDDVRNVNVTASSPVYTGTYSKHAVYQSGSRASSLSYTAHADSSGASPKAGPSTGSYESILDFGFDRFTTCLHGGADGLNIKEREPFNNTVLSGKTETDSYAFNSVKVAIDSLRDPERVEFNLLSMPGLTNNSLNDALIKMCELRADALAIVDLQGGYVPDTENSGSDVSRRGSIATTVSNLKNSLQPNSSYACAYYPWVQIRDNINGAVLWAPPSIAALGAMSYSEANSQLWFAPAGFTRGGLSANQAAGIPVTGVRQRLTSKERDTLYDAGINPIATFPAEGIVIFGQKTLQLTRSALDRINVRRLVLFLKKQISRFAATILFDQNVETTWNRFKSKVEPFLGDVKAGLGITDYRLILDETTTTPDLIDRNIMYAKIYIKPARAIEYIAIDFIITDSGASFED